MLKLSRIALGFSVVALIVSGIALWITIGVDEDEEDTVSFITPLEEPLKPRPILTVDKPGVLEDGFFSDEAPYSMTMVNGWEYDPEPAAFFLPPADGFKKGTAKFEIGQIGVSCVTAEQALEWITPHNWNSTIEPEFVSGIQGVRIASQDQPWESITRSDFGTTDVYEVNIYFIYECFMWRISLYTEVTEMESIESDFDQMVDSIQFGR